MSASRLGRWREQWRADRCAHLSKSLPFLAALQGQGRERRPNLVIVDGTFLGMPNLARHVLRRVAVILQLPSFFEMTVERPVRQVKRQEPPNAV